MPFEPILLFLIIRYLRSTLRSFAPDAWWQRTLTIIMYVIAAVYIAEIATSAAYYATWIWVLLLIATIIYVFINDKFKEARTTIYAFIPIVAVALFSEITELTSNLYFKKTAQYIDYAYLAATTWMIAMLILSRNKQKALKAEMQKRLEEEDKRKFIQGQNDILETQVSERTSELRQQKEELHQALEELRSAQAQLIQSEKMASLGELTAGIAHEIQNPLNFVNNFSEINAELIAEMKQHIDTNNLDEAKAIARDINDNQQKITFHGRRADSIIKNMLQHSRKNTGQKEQADLNALADEYLRLSYHGLRAKDKSFNAAMKTDFDKTLGKISMVPQDIGRVLLNLFNNAFYAVTEKKKAMGDACQPTVTVTTQKLDKEVKIVVKDNGNGIDKKIVDKIFQPFFTTKPTGQGTGLGLSMCYDIVSKVHNGKITVETKEGEGTEFIIVLPL